MSLKTLSVILVLLLSACFKEYDQHNPLDPGFTGNRTREISISSNTVEELIGNLDDYINKGEKISLYISILNSGNSEVRNVRANINISEEEIVVDDFYSNLEWGNVSAGSISNGKGGINVSEAEGRIIFTVNNEAPVDECIQVHFDFYDELDNHWLDTLSFEVVRTNAVLEIDTVEVIEGTSDISNRYFKFYPHIINLGTSSTQQVWSVATVEDSTIQLVFSGDDPSSYGDIESGEIKTPGFPYPEFRFSNTLLTPLAFMMYFEIHDVYENYWYDSTMVFVE